MSERVRITRHGAVAHVELNRPDKKNGLDLAMFEALAESGAAVGADTSVRAVVLSGAGGCFCAGLDFQAFMAGAKETADRILNDREGITNLAQRVAWTWQEAPMPVIAAIEGVAFGGGCQIAAGADIRIASPDARLSVMEIRWGIIPDMGITQTLAPLLRPDVLRELTWTGRVVGAPEALEIGLVTRLAVDPVAAAMELAATIASKNPHAIRASKALLIQAPGLEIQRALELESDLQRPILGSPNQMEAVMANFQKRPPVFKD